MNNDLISRKAVIELIENCHVLEDAYCLIDYINELPIAYDVNGVINKLKQEEIEIIKATEDIYKNPMVSPREAFLISNSNLVMLGKYIEIVKSGFLMNNKEELV